MNISGVQNQVKDKAGQYKNSVKDSFNNTFKPFVKEQIKQAKTLTKDTVDFVKKNPKKIGKFAAVGLLVASAGAAVVTAIKDYINTKQQNKILTKFVVMQKKSNDELKDFIGKQNVIINAKDVVVEAQNKVIEKQKEEIAELKN